MPTTASAEASNNNANINSLGDYCKRKARRSLGMHVDGAKRQGDTLKRSLETPSASGSSSIGRVLKNNKSNEYELGRVTLGKLFHEEPGLMIDEQHVGDKPTSGSSQPECVKGARGRMKAQTVDRKVTLAEQEKRVVNAERVLNARVER